MIFFLFESGKEELYDYMTKREETCLSKYGVKNISQTETVRRMIIESRPYYKILSTKIGGKDAPIRIENDFDLLETLRTHPKKGEKVSYKCTSCEEEVVKLIECLRARPVLLCRKCLLKDHPQVVI